MRLPCVLRPDVLGKQGASLVCPECVPSLGVHPLGGNLKQLRQKRKYHLGDGGGRGRLSTVAADLVFSFFPLSLLAKFLL